MAEATITENPERGVSGRIHDAVPPLVGATGIGLILGWSITAATGGRGASAALTGLGSLWSVLFVITGFVAYRPWAAALLRGGPLPSARTHLRSGLLRVLPLWWIGVVATILFAPAAGDTMPTDAFSPVPAGETAVPLGELLRHLTLTQIYTLRPSSPMPGGWLIATGMAFVVAVPFAARVLARMGGGDRPSRLRIQTVVASTALLIAFGYRIVLLVTAGERVGAAAARTWLPNHLDLFAVGMILAVLSVEAEDGGPAAPFARRLRALVSGAARIVGPALGAVLLLVAGALRGSVVEHRFPSPPVELLVSLLVLVAAALIAAPALLAIGSGSDRSARCRPLVFLGRLTLGSVIWFSFVLARWVSAPTTDGGAPLPARHPGRLFDVAIPPTVAFVLIGVLLCATVTHFVVERPLHRLLSRPIDRFRGGLWTVSILSFLTRIWGMGAVTSNDPGNGDPFFYHAQANMLADRVGFAEPIQWLTEGRFVPSAIHPPIFTLWLTPSSILGARGFLAHKTMGAIAGVLVVVVTALLVRELVGARGGLIAAVIVALYPNLWLIDGTLWPEGLYTATVGLALLMAYRWRDRPSYAAAAALGAACGIAILTRGEALLLLPLLCLPLAWSARRPPSERLRHLVVMGLAAAVLLVPWIIRNQIRFGEFVAVSTNSEEVLFYANCDDVYSGESMGFWSFACQERVREERIARGLSPDPPGNEAQRARAWGEMGRRYALDHRDRLPAVAVARVARAWDLAYSEHNVRALVIEGRPRPWARAGLWIYRIVGIAGIAGIALLRRRGRVIWPLVSIIAMVTIIAVYAYGHVRFRTAGDLVLIVGAAVLLDTILPGRRSNPT